MLKDYGFIIDGAGGDENDAAKALLMLNKNSAGDNSAEFRIGGHLH